MALSRGADILTVEVVLLVMCACACSASRGMWYVICRVKSGMGRGGFLCGHA